MKKFNSLIPILTMIAIILVSLSASCDKRNPPPIVPAPPKPIPLEEIRTIHKMSATPDTIYSDNNITYSNVSVEIRDGEGFGVPSQIVQFKTAPIGRVLTNVSTDSTGVATTVFWDDGQAGIANVTAIVRNFHESVDDSLVSADTLTTQITVIEPPAISDVTLHFDNLQDPFPMQVAQSVPVHATVLNEGDEVVPDGTLVTFECIKGKFVDASDNDLGKVIHQPTYNGRASIYYNSGTSATTNPESVPETVTARIGDIEDTRGIMIRPGTPFGIDIKSYVSVDGEEVEADTSHVGSPNQIFMESTLVDMYNNTVQGKNVKFTTDLGTFINTTQSVNIQTNQYGIARVRFTPGLFAGAATIQASALNDTLNTQLIFTITSDEIHAIDFTQQAPIELNVANTGGTQSAVLRVKLRDINGNLIDEPQDVYFRIMNTSDLPDGANLNNQAPTDSVMVLSNGGEAQISVNAGTQSGVLIIRASCTTEEGRWIRATKPNIIIEAGPPNSIEPFISGYNVADNMGGGVWRIVAGAHVRDLWQNPVQDGTVVWFALYGPGANADYEPYTAAQIESFGEVGNNSVNGDSLSGAAYTTISYHGEMTNEFVTIYAQSGDDMGVMVDRYREVKLPLQDPRFEIQVVPQIVNFGQEGPPNEKTADITMTLTDGQGLPITGSEVLLLTSRGEIILHSDHYFPSNPSYNQIPPNYEDINHPELVTTFEGGGHGRVQVYRIEFPIGDGFTNTPSTTDVGITGRLMGTNQQATTNLTVYRYPYDPPPF